MTDKTATLASNEQNPMPPLAICLGRASTFRGFGRLANAEQKFVVVLADEVQRLTRELEIQKAVVELAYIPHRSLVESRDRADAEIARLRPMAESWESYEAAQDRKGSAAETAALRCDVCQQPHETKDCHYVADRKRRDAQKASGERCNQLVVTQRCQLPKGHEGGHEWIAQNGEPSREGKL